MKKDKLKTAIIITAIILIATVIAFILKTVIELLTYDWAQTSFPAYAVVLLNLVYFFIPILFESVIFAVLLKRKKILAEKSVD